jgi:hypothetical protein
MAELARLLDRAELDAATGPHGRMSIELTAQPGEEVSITVPARLVCARCDGGGCDTCHRSGALRLEAPQTLQFVLPNEAAESFRVRLMRPVEGLEQLTVEVRLKKSTALVRAHGSALAVRPSGVEPKSIVIGIALAIAAAIVFILSRM